MTDYSKADLRNRALSQIGVKETEEAPSADDASLVDTICQQMIESLDDENILIFDPTTSVATQIIPGRIMRAMCDLLAWEISPSFARPRGDRGPLVMALRRQILQGSDPIPVRADFF